MSRPPITAWRPRAGRVWGEPTVRFFILGACLFAAHRLVVGDPRVIAVGAGVRAEVERRFRDQHGRPPAPAELAAELGAWKREEALYREALRQGLDRHDGTIRTLLADRVRARVALALPPREPTPADLDQWLAQHRGDYELPRRYDYDTVRFPKNAGAELHKFERAVTRDGADPRSLGRPIVGGNLTAEELAGRLGPELASRIQDLPVGRWQRLETTDELLLARVTALGGGLPAPGELRARIVADWTYADRARRVDAEVQAIVNRYRFEDLH